jgi:hypothetical protein
MLNWRCLRLASYWTAIMVAGLQCGCVDNAAVDLAPPQIVEVPISIAENAATPADAAAGPAVNTLQLRIGAVLGLDCAGERITTPRDVQAGSFDLVQGDELRTPFHEGQCGLELQTTLASPGDELVSLRGATLRVEGTLPEGTEFAAHSTRSLVVTLEASGPLRASDDFVLLLQPDELFFGLTAGSLDTDADGVAQLTADSNAALLATLESNLPRAFELYRDEDGDGEVSSRDRLLARGHP